MSTIDSIFQSLFHNNDVLIVPHFHSLHTPKTRDYSKVIGMLHIDFDEDGNVVECSGNPVFPMNPDRFTVRDADPRYDMNATDAATMISHMIEISQGQARAFNEDESTLADLAVYEADVEVLSQTVVTQSSEIIPLEAGGYESGSCDLVAQGFLLNPLSTADVAIQNRGGCRTGIDEGKKNRVVMTREFATIL